MCFIVVDNKSLITMLLINDILFTDTWAFVHIALKRLSRIISRTANGAQAFPSFFLQPATTW